MDETPPDWLFEDYEWDSTALTARLSEGPSSGPSSAMEVQGPSSSGKLATASRATCRVAGCDRYPEKPYYKKYRICIRHAKSPAVVIDGVGQRFCQKVSALPWLTIAWRLCCTHFSLGFAGRVVLAPWR